MRDTLEHVGPGRWLLPPMPTDDADALQRLAADWRELAALLDAEARRASSVVDRLRRDWQGPGSLAAPTPLRRLLDDTATVCRALHDAADQVDALAVALRHAREQHGWSWRKITAIGAVVVVSAAAITVTVGSAGAAAPGAAAAEGAVVGAAAAEMAAASTTALLAKAAARALLAVAQLARTVQTVRAVVVPRLVLASMQAPVWIETPIGAGLTSGAIAAGLDVVDGEDDGVDWLAVAFTTLVGAGEVYALSPGRSRGFRPLSDRDYERMSDPSERASLIRINRRASAQGPRNLSTNPHQLKTHFKRAELLGVDRNYNRVNAVAFESALRRFVASDQTVRIEGRWTGRPAVIYADYDSRLVVVCRPGDEFWSLFALSPPQRWHLWYERSLGGH
jgi:uncharacterized protein YukE